MSTSLLDRPTAPRAREAAAFPTFPAWVLLLLGGVVVPLTQLRWNVALLGWVAPVPFLLYLRRAETRRGRFLLLAALLVAFNVQWLKAITFPVPWLLAPSYAVPVALVWWAVYLAWDRIRRRAGESWGIYVFPALVALAETAAYRLTPFGMWGSSVTSQLENLPLLQLASLAGVAGIGFVMAWVASVLGALLAARQPVRLRAHVAALGLALVAVFAYGSVRLFGAQGGPNVHVAGVVADLGPSPAGLPPADAVAKNTEELFLRTESAAAEGARLIVWNEAATVVERSDEDGFLQRGATLARARGVDLVLAYLVPQPEGPYLFENKYVWLSERGEVLETYLKHHPVPGEGSVPGTEPLRSIERPYATVAGAICYDYDFPALGLAHARLGAGLVVVPSSDWRGIDPYHTEMARLRAIEGGFSLLRPVRWATSGAFDAYGRPRASLSHFEPNERVMHALLPVERVETLYARIGDLPAIGYVLLLVLALGAGVRRKSA